jgi:glycerol-3-phosphate acyltransferase PlsX
MGSDNPPHFIFEAILKAVQANSTLSLVAIGTHSVILDLRSKYHAPLTLLGKQIIFHPVQHSIKMTDDPLSILTERKKNSSLFVGIRLLKKGKIKAFITAGNTGALIASATLNLPRLPGIKRPALLVTLPTATGYLAVLDVGGSVLSKAHYLIQFAYMGVAYQQALGIVKPKVGLLNIGVEPKKGNSIVREAYQALKEDQVTPMEFVGNVEGREIFSGSIDVLVTDGFTGNVLLKTSEGVSSFIFEYVESSIKKMPEEPLHQAFDELKKEFNYKEYPGAIICGVEGLVMKCHGSSSTQEFLNSIRGASQLIESDLISKMKERLLFINELD